MLLFVVVLCFKDFVVTQELETVLFLSSSPLNFFGGWRGDRPPLVCPSAGVFRVDSWTLDQE